MVFPSETDYHIHCYLDECSHPDMTLPNIDYYSFLAGLNEIAVLKHFSESLPNGKDSWFMWKRIDFKDFITFLKEVRFYKSQYGIIFKAGVETELLDEEGNINIPKEYHSFLDFISLSTHFMIEYYDFHTPSDIFPMEMGSNKKVQVWTKKANAYGLINLIRGLVRGYIKAIQKNPKIKVLSDLHDGLFLFREYYQLNVDTVPMEEIVQEFIPLFKILVEKKILWEININRISNFEILDAANKMGVAFTAATDAHNLSDGKYNILNHNKIEQTIVANNLRRGKLG
jgi:histidinol phosphatase-like PHP family hydrolase